MIISITTCNLFDYKGRFQLEADTSADMICCGKGFIPTGNTEMVSDVEPIKNMAVRTCATAYDHQEKYCEMLILEFIEDMEHSLLSPNQVQALFNRNVCLNPKQYTNEHSLHSINCEEDNLTFKFQMLMDAFLTSQFEFRLLTSSLHAVVYF